MYRRIIVSLIVGLLILGLCGTASAAGIPAEFLTTAEATDYLETSTYDQAIAYIRQLEAASDLIRMSPIGITPQGRTMYLAVLSKDKAFTPQEAAATGKPIVLVQNGIHPGEICGKEASLALMRDILITKEHENLLDNVIFIVVPVFSVDGHENSSPDHRANQIGPATMGFRATAQRLNLNRDFLKADSPEMQAWTRMFVAWRPHLLIDNHVTDGADYQYAITSTITRHQNAPAGIRAWSAEQFMPAVKRRLHGMGHEISPYVTFRGDDPSGGLWSWVASPRFSTGYAIIHNRPGMLVEMHMLKDFKTRVVANYALMLAVLQELNDNPQALVDAVKQAEEETLAGLTEPYPLGLRNPGDSVMIDFLGYEYEYVRSEIAGKEWVRYFPDKPVTMRIPYFNQAQVTETVIPPKYYLIPQEWRLQVERLSLNGVELRRLTEPLTVEVETYKLTEPEWAERSYEGRHRVSFQSETINTPKTFPTGTIVVPMKQLAAKVAMQLLEPKARDSFVAWGFFNTIFERKEYLEEFAAEKLAVEMLAADPELKAEFEAQLDADSTFRNSPRDRWYFFYQRSKYYEKDLNYYPVARLLNEVVMLTERYVP
ncbi:M14 family zinc carboxypeptidase [Candidatus Zixiibacteriota bacterium]